MKDGDRENLVGGGKMAMKIIDSQGIHSDIIHTNTDVIVASAKHHGCSTFFGTFLHRKTSISCASRQTK